MLERGHPSTERVHAPLTPHGTPPSASGRRDQARSKEQPAEAKEKPEYSFATPGEAASGTEVFVFFFFFAFVSQDASGGAGRAANGDWTVTCAREISFERQRDPCACWPAAANLEHSGSFVCPASSWCFPGIIMGDDQSPTLCLFSDTLFVISSPRWSSLTSLILQNTTIALQ